MFNPVISIANVENAQESTRLLAQTSLRNVLGTGTLAQILANRDEVCSCMRDILDEATYKWSYFENNLLLLFIYLFKNKIICLNKQGN